MSDAKPAEAEAPKKKSKVLLFIGIGVIVLALVGGGGAYMLMKKKAAAEADGEDGEEVAAETHKPAKKEGKHEPPVFVKLEPFTVRLQNDTQDSYLQAVPELRVLDLHLAEDVKQYMPEIRHKALLVIAAKKPSDVNTPDGVQKLSNELRVTINAILAPPTEKKKKKKEVEAEISDTADPDDPVQAVLFTSFIVQ